MGKIYVLDTNVLIQAPYAPSCFEENEVVIPLVVLEELDNLRRMKESGEPTCAEPSGFWSECVQRGT